jgi:hypothetical protein
MDLTVLSLPDCPNVMLLEERLAQVLEGRTPGVAGVRPLLGLWGPS